MRILVAVHGFPPELVGGVELHTQELVLALARAGHKILVVAGTLIPSARSGSIEVRRTSLEGVQGEQVEIARIARHDLYFDHWHKSLCADVSRAYRDLLREFRPEVVHVQHWLRLSRDLVAVAAREKIPSVVTLHDSWASCPIVFRVRPDTLAACDAPVGPHPCVKCAGRVPPRTPWVPTEALYMLLSERQRDIGREIDLARAVITPTLAHARALERHLGRASGALDAKAIAPCSKPARGTPPSRSTLPESSAQTVKLASWSQIARHKGLDLLVEAYLAAERELGQHPRLELEIHGAESDPAFAARLRESTRESSVRWGGPYSAGLPGAQLDPGAELFVNSTRAHESYGLSSDEACRLGLALLLPDAPVFQERFSKVAQFYEGGSAASLAREIVRLARDPLAVARGRKASAQFAERLPSSEALAALHGELYASAARAGAPAASAENWFDARMSAQATLEWDRALSQRSREELGL